MAVARACGQMAEPLKAPDRRPLTWVNGFEAVKDHVRAHMNPSYSVWG